MWNLTNGTLAALASLAGVSGFVDVNGTVITATDAPGIAAGFVGTAPAAPVISPEDLASMSDLLSAFNYAPSGDIECRGVSGKPETITGT